MSAREIGYNAFVDVSLRGDVDVEAYEIGTGAARLGAVTIIAEDRHAAVGLAQAAILLQDVSRHLSRRAALSEASTAYDSDITAVVAMRGSQPLRDLALVPADSTETGDGYARFSLGHLRITVHDHVAAIRSSKALTRAYGTAATTLGSLPDIDQLREATHRRRGARVATSQRRIPQAAATTTDVATHRPPQHVPTHTL